MLELKVPPPAVVVIVAAAMWGISLVTARFGMPEAVRVPAAIAIAIAGVGIAIAAIVAFRHAHTTISPVKPEAASSLVTSGVFGFTRNPMYLGLCLVLVAWAVFLSSAFAFAGPVAFVLYISRFQIAPEERVLARTFGESFSKYRANVRRWI